MTMHKTTEFYTEWFNICPNITSTFPTIAVLESFVKQHNGSYITRRYVHNILLYHTSFVQVNGSRVVSMKQKVVSPLKIYQSTKFDGPTLTGASFAYTSEI
jgi:hypothetical protein